MRVCVFGSGSKGNCLSVLAEDGTRILVDCGILHRDLLHRAHSRGVAAESAVAILFTHDHADHIAGLAVFRKKHPGTALYANGDTADAIAAKTGVQDGWNIFETAEAFDIRGFRVTPFSVAHDAADPVGFLIEDVSSGRRRPPALFIGTDTGVATIGFRDALSRADCAVLEANHDPVLLQTSGRPLALKRRIAGRSGHLSNDDAAEALRLANPPHLKKLLLAHISQECNSTPCAMAAFRAVIAELGRGDMEAVVLDQDEPSCVFEV